MSRRITQHPILEYLDMKDRKKVYIIVNGKKVEAYEGEPIAAALIANGVKVFRKTPKLKSPRGVFCVLGRCADCIMNVNGTPSIRTCVTPVKEGMIIESQDI